MNEATAKFIREHADDDVRQLALRGMKDPEVNLVYALDQIAGRQTARRKLPSWAATEGIIYPPHLSMEQCSSEQTAHYKAAIMRELSERRRMVDLTGGFGVDFSFLARSFEEAIYVERQQPLCDIARENFRRLGIHQAEVVCGDAEEYLRNMPKADLIYIDPARRDSHGGRTYALSDCTPDVLALRNLLLSKAERVLLKLSPMLDWRKAVCDLGEEYVREIHIVSVQNECKELLLVMADRGFRGARNVESGVSARPLVACYRRDARNVHCVNLTGEGEQHFVFAPQISLHTPPSTLHEKSFTLHEFNYLYEPNASIMKAGCFDALAQQFCICQIAQNSHLFVSDVRVNDFPGREFAIESVSTMGKHELKKKLGGMTQANIAVRNFPLTVAELRRRLKLSEGGSTYIFATTLADKSHVLLITRKLCTEP